MNELRLAFEWEPVLSGERANYLFPEAITKFFRSRYSGPAVYRWAIFESKQLQKVYYGEAEVLARRIDNYRHGNKSQQTAARMKEFLLSLEGHFEIRLDIFRFESFLLNGIEISEQSLCKKDVRCFFENFLIVTTPSNVQILNKLASTEQKQIEKASSAFKKLREIDRQRVINHFVQQNLGGKKINATQE